MAQTKIVQPQELATAHNPLRCIVDSTNKNERGFAYIFDIYSPTGATLVASYRVLPRATDGYGEIDLLGIARALVYPTLPSTTTYQDVTSIYKNIFVKTGEELTYKNTYTASVADDGNGNCEIALVGANTFTAGDYIEINQADSGVANPLLEGLVLVLSSAGSDIVVNVPFSSITDATINGTIYFASGAKTVTSNILTFDTFTVVDAALKWSEVADYDDVMFDLSGSNKENLNNFPSEFRLRPSMNLYSTIHNHGTTNKYIYFENSNGAVFRYQLNTASEILVANVGTNAAPNLVSGSGSFIDDTVTHYEWYVANSVGFPLSESKQVTIDRRCAINDYDIMFFDRRSSWGCFTMSLRAKLTGNVKRETFNRDLTGTVADSRWGYSKQYYGQATFAVDSSETWEMNSDFMTEAENEYFKELVSSPLTYIRLNDGNWYACTIKTSDFEVEFSRNNKRIRKTIQLEISGKDAVNG